MSTVYTVADGRLMDAYNTVADGRLMDAYSTVADGRLMDAYSTICYCIYCRHPLAYHLLLYIL